MFKSLFTILLVVFCLATQAQIASALVTVDDGMPINSAWTITQDKNGVMWFGTIDGLCSYDGFTTKTYKTIIGDTTSISENCRHDVYVDKANNLWVAHTNGISKFNQQTEKFSNIYVYSEKKNRDIINRIVGEDNSGNIWTWIYGEGLVVFNEKGEIVMQYGITSINSQKCITAQFDLQKNIYLSIDQTGFYKFNMATKQFENFPYARIGSFCITSDNKFLMPGLQNEILLSDKLGNTLESYTIDQAALSKPDILLYFNTIIAFSGNEYYIGTTDGIFILNLQEKSIKRFVFSKIVAENYAIGDCLYKDASGNLWAGTTASGVRRFLLSSKKFELLTPSNNDHTIVKAINKNAQNLFVGYFDGGMDIYNLNHELISHINNTNTNLPSNHVNAIMPLSDDNLLIGFTLSFDIGILNWKTKSYESILDRFPNLKSSFNSIENLANCFSKIDNSTYLLNRNEFIYKLTFINNNISLEKIDSINKAITTYVFSDKRKHLWVGSYNGLYHKNNGKWDKIKLPVDLNVKCIAQHPNGEIWVCGDKGLFILDDNGKLKLTINTGNGLPNEYVYGLLFEPDGDCWMSHNKGISKFNYASLTFRNYNKSDGVQSNEFNTGAFFNEPNGYFYLGGINGVNYFKPEAIKDNSSLTITRIQTILVNDEPIKSDSSHAYLKQLNLKYDENTVSIHFVGIEYTNPGLNRYKYRLIGVDKAWVDAGTQRQVRYPNLSPGNYVFEVISCNNDGIWNITSAQLTINIMPPYWQTTWFRTIGIILIVTLLVISVIQINKYNTRKQRRLAEIQQKLQAERERISRDLHDNVGAQLSFINSNIDWIINPVKATNKEEEHNRLAEVSLTAQNIIGNLRETIWALNKQAIEVEDLSDKLKAYFQKQMQFATTINLVFKEEIINNITFSPSTALHIFRIGQEIANNCLKYANATAVTVAITTSLNGDFSLSISDNGIGFNMNDINGSSHYGIANMKARAKEIGGNLSIQSQTNNGTQIVLEISHDKILQM